jgi:hypothetical protein
VVARHWDSPRLLAFTYALVEQQIMKIQTFAEFLHMTYPEKQQSGPEFMETLDLSGRLIAISIATEDQESANIMDAAAVRLMELLETIDKLREELALCVRGFQ